MTGVLFNFTNKCNLQCRHCYASCEQQGETMGLDNIVKVLEHIPKNTSSLSISGGEPFMKRDLLMQMLIYIKENKQKILPAGNVNLLTNGFWIRDNDDAYHALKMIYEQNVFSLNIVSRDKFHREQGLIITPNMSQPNGIIYNLVKKLSEEKNVPLWYDGDTALNLLPNSQRGIFMVSINGSNFAYPFGRGRNLGQNEQKKTSQCNIITHSHKRTRYNELTIAADGKAYPCCWRVTPAIGSAIENPLEELAKGMWKNEVFRALLEEGPEGVANLLGVYRKGDKIIYERNPCVKCEEIFRGIR
ncbi:MAG: radical SAM protein [Candidatus Nanoarchaeia archaeon]|nr:radical SAM protein [Candidatus Nanoarchaeia archaeon]